MLYASLRGRTPKTHEEAVMLMTMRFGAVVALAAAAGLGCCGTASAFVVPPSAALFCEGARYFGGIFRVLPLARRKSSSALQR